MNKTDCKNVFKYIKKTKKKKKELNYDWDFVVGIPVENDKKHIYKWISSNKFENKPTKISNGYIKKKLSKKHIKNIYCKDKNYTNEWDKKFKNYKLYFTLDNGSKPFMVAIRNKTVKIYMEDPKNIIPFRDDISKYYYTHLIKTFTNVENIFIGKSPLIKMTEYSGAHGEQFDGNSILLKIKDKKYVY